MELQASLVLVVDDMPDGLELLAETLQRAGFRVAVASDGRAALDQAFALGPSLIVLDLSLPEVDGWEVARQLKQDPRTMHIPILALSAFALPIHRDRALSAGAAAFLSKPCPPADLLVEIKRLLTNAEPNDHVGSLRINA
ncbi:MAG TPA: response regulator [Polyangiaceae bacterium]|nr:response regulator [Polyangiaceae bacterium]